MALSDYLTNLGIDKSLLDDAICEVLSAKFFRNSTVVQEDVIIPMATDTSNHMILRLGSNKHISGIKEMKYYPLVSCNNILIDINNDIRDI